MSTMRVLSLSPSPLCFRPCALQQVVEGSYPHPALDVGLRQHTETRFPQETAECFGFGIKLPLGNGAFVVIHCVATRPRHSRLRAAHMRLRRSSSDALTTLRSRKVTPHGAAFLPWITA